MKTKIIAGLFLLGMVSGQAQELSAKVYGGLSGIQYDTTIGNSSVKSGGGLGIGFTYYLSNHWGILTGIEGQYSSNEIELYDNQSFSSYEVDDNSSAFNYTVASMGYKETQNFFSFAIPLMLQYRTAVSNTKSIYIGLGGKFLIPSKLKSTVNAEKIALSGYYPDLNLELDDLPSHGFGNLNDWKEDTKITIKTSVLLNMEGGLTFKLKKGMQLYTGIYADYGLTELQDKSNLKNLINYSATGIDNVTANSVLRTERILDQSRYVSAGIQVKLGFMLGKNKTPKEEAIVVQNIVSEEKTVSDIVNERPLVKETTKQQILTYEERAYIEAPLAFGTINQTIVVPELGKKLDSIIQILNKHPKLTLFITGYTCDIGSSSINEKIGMERAESVAKYLKVNGVSAIRIKLYSKGETDPIVVNSSKENRQKNRRVSIEVK